MAAQFDFVEIYRSEMISPRTEDIERRVQVFKQVLAGLNPQQIIGLTRLYFGLRGDHVNDVEWFRQAFASNDVTFSIKGNERESALLAACLLGTSLENGNVLSGLAPLCATLTGQRQPLILSELIPRLDQELRRISYERRENIRVQSPDLGLAEQKKFEYEADSLANDGDAIEGFILEVDEQIREDVSDVIQRAMGVDSYILSEFRMLREEVNILWWYISGWSKSLDRPLSELDLGAAAVVAGVDMASLVHTPPGRVAVPALLQRLIAQDRKIDRASKRKAISIRELVAQLPQDDRKLLPFGSALPLVGDICPILTALLKSSENSLETAWVSAFTSATEVSEEMAFTPFNLGLQAFREAMLVSLLDGE